MFYEILKIQIIVFYEYWIPDISGGKIYKNLFFSTRYTFMTEETKVKV